MSNDKSSRKKSCFDNNSRKRKRMPATRIKVDRHSRKRILQMMSLLILRDSFDYFLHCIYMYVWPFSLVLIVHQQSISRHILSIDWLFIEFIWIVNQVLDWFDVWMIGRGFEVIELYKVCNLNETTNKEFMEEQRGNAGEAWRYLCVHVLMVCVHKFE